MTRVVAIHAKPPNQIQQGHQRNHLEHSMRTLTQQQSKILTLVGTFSYLSTKDVAKLAWPHTVTAAAKHSAHVMAQASLARLLELGLVLARDLREQYAPKRKAPPPKTGVAKGYVLTKKGAEELNNHWVSEWCATDLATDNNPMLWFADGYNLSLKDHIVRAPVIDLCHQMMASWSRLDDTDPLGQNFLSAMAVGQRGASRNFLGLKDYAHFDAVLVTNRFDYLFGVYLADPLTATATAKVTKLAKKGDDFLIAVDRPARLQVLTKWREETAPAMGARVAQLLHIGVDA